MWRRKPKRCAPYSPMVREAVWLGMGEGLGLALPLALGFLILGWEWPVGLLWGFAAVGIGRLVRWNLIALMLREGGGGLAAGLTGVARHLLVSFLTVGGILAGLPALAVAGGLLIPTLGRFFWMVRLARTPG